MTRTKLHQPIHYSRFDDDPHHPAVIFDMATSGAPRPQWLASRPPPRPKPSHLFVAITGTVNSAAFADYIKAQSTGGSSFLPRRGEIGSDDEDDNGEKWATAPPEHTPTKTMCLEHLCGEDAEHGRSQSSVSTITGRPDLSADHLQGRQDDEVDLLISDIVRHAETRPMPGAPQFSQWLQVRLLRAHLYSQHLPRQPTQREHAQRAHCHR